MSSSYEAEIQAAASEIQTASAQAVEQYKKIAELQPNDPTVQLELAQAAQSANDIATTIAAYESVPEARSERPDRARGPPHPQAVQAVRPERVGRTH